MAKQIKFNLPINGASVRNIEELRDNFSPEILDLLENGLLLKWLQNRDLNTQAESVSNISITSSKLDQLVKLSEIFEIDSDPSLLEKDLLTYQQKLEVSSVTETPQEEQSPENTALLTSVEVAGKVLAAAVLAPVLIPKGIWPFPAATPVSTKKNK